MGGASILSIIISVIGAVSAAGTVLGCAYKCLPDGRKHRIKRELFVYYNSCVRRCAKVGERHAEEVLEKENAAEDGMGSVHEWRQLEPVNADEAEQR